MGLVKDAVDKQFDDINLSKIETILEKVREIEQEQLVISDENGMLDILKAKDRYMLDMENSLYSSWAFDRLRITG